MLLFFRKHKLWNSMETNIIKIRPDWPCARQLSLRLTCGLIPLPGSAKLHTGSGMTKVDFYYAQMTSGVWGQWLSLCQVYRTAFRSRDIICDKIYGLKVGLHCFKELQFIGQSETMGKKILFVDPPWRPIRNVLLWQQQLSRWLVNSLRASVAGETGPQSDKQVLLNILKENGDSVEQERIFSWRNSLITARSSLPRPV